MAGDYYIMIMDFGDGAYYHFLGPNSVYYLGFRKNAEKGGHKVAAEVFNVSAEALERASKNGLLRDIADRLQSGEEMDAQKELEAALGKK